MGSLGGGLSSMFGGSAQDESMKYLNDFGTQISPYYQNSMAAGNRAQGALGNIYSKIMQDPASIMRMLGEGYEESPGYEWNYDQAMRAGNSAAAAGGMIGSPSHQLQASTTASGLASQDYYRYLEPMLQMWGRGLSGIEGAYKTGVNSSDALASMLAGNMMNQAELAGQGKAEKNSAMGGILGGLGGAATSLWNW